MNQESVSFAYQDRHYIVDYLGQNDDWQFTRVLQESTSTRTDPHHRTIWSDRRPISKTIRPILDQAEIRVRRQVHRLYLDPHAAILWEAYGTLIGGPNETFFRSYIQGTPEKRHILVTDDHELSSRTAEETVWELERLGVPATSFSGVYRLPERLWGIAAIRPRQRTMEQHRLMDAWKPDLAEAGAQRWSSTGAG